MSATRDVAEQVYAALVGAEAGKGKEKAHSDTYLAHVAIDCAETFVAVWEERFPLTKPPTNGGGRGGKS